MEVVTFRRRWLFLDDFIVIVSQGQAFMVNDSLCTSS